MRRTERPSRTATARPIQFHRIVVDIKRGTDIGLLGKGIGYCTQWRRWLYRSGDLSFSGKELTETFRSVLTAANYSVLGDPHALFDDPSAWKAEYLVAGAVKSMNVELCYFYSEFKGDTDSLQTSRELGKEIVPHEQHGLAEVSDTFPIDEPGIPVFLAVPS